MYFSRSLGSIKIRVSENKNIRGKSKWHNSEYRNSSNRKSSRRARRMDKSVLRESRWMNEEKRDGVRGHGLRNSYWRTSAFLACRESNASVLWIRFLSLVGFLWQAPVSCSFISTSCSLENAPLTRLSPLDARVYIVPRHLALELLLRESCSARKMAGSSGASTGELGEDSNEISHAQSWPKFAKIVLWILFDNNRLNKMYRLNEIYRLNKIYRLNIQNNSTLSAQRPHTSNGICQK